ncbi:MAG: molybdopterin oxidoreductase [Evtepia gabavorous]
MDEEEVARQLCPQCREAAKRARCPVCGRETGEMVQEENPTFDWARFQALKEGACD